MFSPLELVVRRVLGWAVAVVVLSIVVWQVSSLLSERAFERLLAATETVESPETYGEHHAYWGCPSLWEGSGDLEAGDDDRLFAKGITSVDMVLLPKLKTAVFDFQALWVPPWARAVEHARQAIIVHETEWIKMLEDQLDLAIRVSDERDVAKQAELFLELLRNEQLSQSSINSSWQSVSHRYKEAAHSDDDLGRVDKVIITDAEPPDCDAYLPAVERWPPS